MNRLFRILAMAVFLAPAPVFAASFPFTLKCSFNLGTYGLDRGEVKTSGPGDMPDITFTVINETTAYVTGNLGMQQVEFSYYPARYAFFENTPASGLNVTVVDKHLNATHSRHILGLSNELWPSQYYGQCQYFS